MRLARVFSSSMAFGALTGVGADSARARGRASTYDARSPSAGARGELGAAAGRAGGGTAGVSALGLFNAIAGGIARGRSAGFGGRACCTADRSRSRAGARGGGEGLALGASSTMSGSCAPFRSASSEDGRRSSGCQFHSTRRCTSSDSAAAAQIGRIVRPPCLLRDASSESLITNSNAQHSHDSQDRNRSRSCKSR